MQQYVLKYISPDQAGITHALTGVISRAQGNILESAQFSDFESGKFCVRIKFESPAPRERLRTAFADQLEPFDPIIQLREANQHRRALVMVSQLDHCLDDLLYRYRRGELSVEIRWWFRTMSSCDRWSNGRASPSLISL